MRLINIKLTNFRKYVAAEVDLPDGLTGVLGQNGTGKSTLLEAVGWVLYGSDAARTGKDDIRRQSASSNDVCRVELTFAIGGVEYNVVREMRGKNLTTDASLISGGQVIVRGAQPVLDQVVKIVGLDREAFFVSFFARQKELNALSDYRPADRKSLIIKMLGIADVDKAIELVKLDRREVEATVTGLRLRLPDANLMTADLVAAKQAVVEAEANLKEIAARSDLLDARLVKAKEAFATEEHKRKDSEEAQRHRELAAQNAVHFKALAQEKQSELDELKALKTARDKTAPAIRFAAEQTAANARIAAEQTGEHLKKAEDAARESAEGRAAAQKSIAAAEARRSEIQRAVDRLTKQEASLESLGPEGVCPTCLRPLAGDMESIQKHFKQDIAGLVEEINSIEKEIAGHRDTESRLQKENTEHNVQAEAMRQAAVHAQDIEQRVSRLIQSLPSGESAEDPNLFSREISVEEKLSYLAQRRDEVLRSDTELARLPETAAAVKDLAAKATAAEAEIKALDKAGGAVFDVAVYEAAEAEFETAREERHQLDLSIKDAEKEKDLAVQQAASLQRDLDQAEKIAADIKTFEEKAVRLKSLEKTFGAFRKHLIGRIRPALAEKAGELIYDLTDGKYSRLELDEDYEIYLYDEGGRFSIERFSGGEKDLANLCLRLAISLTLADRAGSDYGFIVLDEIFGSQDSVRKMNIMRALSALNKRFRQIFLITHVDDIKDEVEHIISVTETETGLSQATLS